MSPYPTLWIKLLSRIIDINWQGPFSFNEGAGFPCVFTSEYAARQGVYLWTILIGDEHRVNYVGKVSGNGRTLGRRLWEERKFCFDGKNEKAGPRTDPLVDVDLFLNEGIRRVLVQRPTLQQVIDARVDIERLINAYQLFLGPLDCDGAIVKRVEGAVDRHLRNCSKCCGFMSPSRVVRAGFPRLSIRSHLPAGVVVCGMGEEFQE